MRQCSMRRRLFAWCAAGLLSACSTYAQSSSVENARVEIETSVWNPSPDVTVSSGPIRCYTVGGPFNFFMASPCTAPGAILGSSPPSTFNLIQRFSVSRKRFGQFGVVVKLSRRQQIHLSVARMAYSGSAVFSPLIVFGDQLFINRGNKSGTADFGWTATRIGYEWDGISTRRGSLGITADINDNRVHARLTGQTNPGEGTAHFQRDKVIPTIGGVGRASVTKHLAVTGEFTALKLTRESNVTFHNFDVYATAHFGRHLGARVGWRSLLLDYVIDQDAAGFVTNHESGKWKMHGPYVGAIVGF